MSWTQGAILMLGTLMFSGDQTQASTNFITNARQLTFSGKSGEGYFSPDGKQLVFQSVREPGNPFYQIYLLNLETGDTHRVSPGTGKTTCAFFRPGADEVLFASTHHDPHAADKQRAENDFIASGKTRRYSWDYDDQMDIYSATRKGEKLRRLTDASGYDAEAAYSPDGKLIVFTSLRNAYPLEHLSVEERNRYETDPAYFADIYIMNADGTEQRRLTKSKGYDGGPFFTADGRRIVWRRFDEKGLIADVFSMNLEGSDVRQITRFESMSWAPYPHPSGRYVIFTSNKHGFENFELFIVDMERQGAPVRVTSVDGFDGLPVFSPDGKKLCWTANRGGDKQSQLYLADWNHDAALAALSQPGSDRAAAPPQDRSEGSHSSSDIADEDVRVHVGKLASDAMDGRKTGTAGAKAAAEYIAGELRKMGVKPLANQSDYFHPFSFTAGVKINESETSMVISNSAGAPTLQINSDFRPLSFSANGTVTGPVVFAGYGLKVPGKLGEGYDSYAGLDVTNKVVMVLRYVPEEVEASRRQELNRYAALRYKAMIAREHGAKAIVFVTGPNSPNAGELIPLTSDGSLSGSQIVAASLSSKAAEQLLAGNGKTLETVQSALDSENPHAEGGFALTNTVVTLGVSLQQEKQHDQNVLAAIPGTSGEYVVLGAHYDHLGHGEAGGSREGAEEKGQIHNGADDNASGVALVLELAGYFGDKAKRGELQRGIIFAFWSGEEMGLLGSSRFVEQPPLPLTNLVAYLNFDMVGRLRDNKLSLQGAGSSPLWRRLIEKRNVAAGFNISVQDDPYLPTDSTAFYPKGIPVLSFFTGSHDDYHRPTDDIETLNYEGVERVANLARGMLQDLCAGDRPEYAKVERSSAPGARDALRAYLGTIPDYATEDIKGVKLSGVRGGSPAEKAGIKGGDIITEFAGQKIANIYDYTYALDAVKIGQPINVTVQREGKSVTVSVTPEARK